MQDTLTVARGQAVANEERKTLMLSILETRTLLPRAVAPRKEERDGL
jgi:hypothetical protein